MAWVKRNWIWIFAGGLVLSLLLLISPPGLFWWNYYGFKSLLHDNAGLEESWAEVGAVLIGTIYALLLPTAGRWLLLGRKKILPIVAAVALLILPPALHGLLDKNFNQSSGVGQKYYIWHSDGSVTLSDSGGYDPNTDAQRHLITPEVAHILERLKEGIRAKPINGDLSHVAFFDPVTGTPRVWYARDANERFKLFDAEGFSPEDGSVLLPVTRDVIAEIQRQTENDHVQRAEEASRGQAERAAAAREAEVTSLRNLFAVDSYSGSSVVVGVQSIDNDEVANLSADEMRLHLISILRGRGVSAIELSPTVYGTPYYADLMAGRIEVLDEIGLRPIVQKMLVGTVSSSCHPSVSIAGVISCNVELRYRVIDLPSKRSESYVLAESGAGSSPSEGVIRATEAIAAELHLTEKG